MSPISGTSTRSQDIRTDYLNLLVVQLQNQNPLEPMSNSDMTAQLAQISQLEQLERLNRTFSQALLGAKLNEAMAMIGKAVAFFPPGENTARSGWVQGLSLAGGEPTLRIGSYNVSLDQIQYITSDEAWVGTALDQAVALIGKEITFIPKDEDGNPLAEPGTLEADEEKLTLRVDGVEVKDDQVWLVAGDYSVTVDEILAINN